VAVALLSLQINNFALCAGLHEDRHDVGHFGNATGHGIFTDAGSEVGAFYSMKKNDIRFNKYILTIRFEPKKGFSTVYIRLENPFSFNDDLSF